MINDTEHYTSLKEQSTWWKIPNRFTTRSSSYLWSSIFELLPNTWKSEGTFCRWTRVLSAWSLKPFGTDLKRLSAQQRIEETLMRNKSSELTTTWQRNDPKYLCHSFRQSHFWQPLEPRLYWSISKLPCWTLGCWTRWLLMITGVFWDMVKPHFSAFVFASPWINQLPLLRMRFGPKVKVFEQLHNPTDEELKKFLIRGQHSSVYDRREKDISYRSEPNVDPESTTDLCFWRVLCW